MPELSTTVARLRTSREEYEEFELDSGHEDGAEWAEETAKYYELEWLEKTGFEKAEHLLRQWTFHQYEPFAAYSEYSFWIEYVGACGPQPPKAYIGGFVRGALEIWMQVKREVEAP